MRSCSVIWRPRWFTRSATRVIVDRSALIMRLRSSRILSLTVSLEFLSTRIATCVIGVVRRPTRQVDSGSLL